MTKIKNLSNDNKNNPLKKYGGALNKHMVTGKKRAYKVTDMLGHSVISSKDHRFIVHRKGKEQYRYLSSLTKDSHDVTVEEMMENFETEDFYSRLHIGNNTNKDYTIKEYIIDNFDYLKDSDWFNVKITSTEIRDKLKNVPEVREIINIDDYWWGVNFWKRTNKWSYKTLRGFITDDDILQQIKDSETVQYCKRNKCVDIDIDVPISPDMMQLLGYIFTDGTYDKYSDYFSMASKHRELLQSYVDIVNSQLGKTLKGAKPTDHNGVKVKSISYNNLLGLLIPIIYDNGKKRPNIEILSRMSRKQFLSFFAGLMDGDGYVSTNGICVCNYDCVKYNFLGDLSELLLWNGIPSRVYKNFINIPSWDINDNNIRNVGEIMLNRHRAANFEKIVWKSLKNSPAKIKSFFYDEEKNDLVVKIRRIDDLGIDVDMYDIETEDHKFLCNGTLVHNCNGFDFPYLINRIVNVLGEEWSRDLSPIGRIYEKVNKTGKFGKPSKEYVVEGISLLDMQIIYKKFAMEKLESYKLDYVAEVELGENKVSYEGNLWELSKKDWSKYCDYNLVDVELLVKLEDKLKYIDLLRFISHLGLCNIEKAVDTVPIITGAIAVQARRRGEYIPTFPKIRSDEKIPGGYVAEPVTGFSEKIVTFDANSLYPSVMISLNLSPETKIGKLEKDGSNYKLYHVSGKRYEMDKDQLKKFMEAEKCSLAKNAFLFSQRKQGIAPEFLDFLYTQRKAMKNKMLKCKGEGDKEGAKTFDTIQNAYKIVLNSTYGYFVNNFAPLADKDIGSAVTLTGQAIIKKSADFAIDYVKSQIPNANEELLSKIYKYSDTDSVVGDTLINTQEGEVKIEDLWKKYENQQFELSNHGHEMRNVDDLFVLSYDKDSKEATMKKVAKVVRHKVSKRKFKIKTGSREVIMTEDHGMVVVRNGQLTRISPKEHEFPEWMLLFDGEEVVWTVQNCVTEEEPFQDEYVYDLEMDDEENPWFFANDILVHNSNFLSFSWTEELGIPFKDEKGAITEEFFDICQKFEDFINESMEGWAIKNLKSADPRIVFKREAICDTSILLGPKYYVLHVLNDEGNKCDKFKYRGVDVVKTTMPKALKPYVKDIIETMVTTQSKDKTNRKFLDAYEVYKKLGPESIYVISTINKYDEWIPKCDKLTTSKGMPHHLKAALAHDYLVDELGLVSKYPKFQNGDKIRMVELKTPNKYGISKIGYKGKWPDEFDQIFTIDFEKMFGKIMYAAIERFFDVAGWVLRKPNENLKVELEDFLS